MRLALVALMMLATSAASAQETPRPAHPAVRYSCMSDPPAGYAWPSVAAGVPQSVEIQHPGWEIDLFDGFSVAGLRLFLIAGGRRAETVDERYAQVEAVDEAGTFLEGRALFLRAIAGVTDADAMARRAMAILLRRADARPLRSAPSDISETLRDRVTAPTITGRDLTFWIRNRADLPYASLITVDLDTGIASGDPG